MPSCTRLLWSTRVQRVPGGVCTARSMASASGRLPEAWGTPPQGRASGGIVAVAVVVTRREDNDATRLWRRPEAAVASFQGTVEHNASPCERDTPWHPPLASRRVDNDATRLWKCPEPAVASFQGAVEHNAAVSVAVWTGHAVASTSGVTQRHGHAPTRACLSLFFWHQRSGLVAPVALVAPVVPAALVCWLLPSPT